MLVLITISAITTRGVYAKSYVSDDTVIINDSIHSYFNNYFDGKTSYLYFPYVCNSNQNYNRDCYLGIDKDGNYVNLVYNSSDTYSTTLEIKTGIDENFSVSGNNVFRKHQNYSYIILVSIAFIFGLYFVSKLIGGI